MQEEKAFEEFHAINMVVPDEQVYHFNQEEVNELLDAKPWYLIVCERKGCRSRILQVLQDLSQCSHQDVDSFLSRQYNIHT